MAGRLLPIALGSDGAGSIRIPSAFCHIFGFKPSVMRLGNLHGSRNVLGLAVMGPLAHTVEDAAAMLDVLAGNPSRMLAEHNGALGQCRREPRSMRIRVCVQSPIGAVATPIADAVHATARVLEELGHRVELAPALTGSLEEFLPLWQKPMSAIPVIHEGLLQPVTRWLRTQGKTLHMRDVHEQQRVLSRRVMDFMGDADMMLTPTVPVLPPEVGAYRDLGPEQTFHAIAPLGAFTAVFNVTGQPAASIPAGVSEERGLPYAVQLAGRVDADGDVLAVCRQLERAMPWRGRRAVAFERGSTP